jgi:hypothetical protein
MKPLLDKLKKHQPPFSSGTTQKRHTLLSILLYLKEEKETDKEKAERLKKKFLTVTKFHLKKLHI